MGVDEVELGSGRGEQGHRHREVERRKLHGAELESGRWSRRRMGVADGNGVADAVRGALRGKA